MYVQRQIVPQSLHSWYHIIIMHMQRLCLRNECVVTLTLDSKWHHTIKMYPNLCQYTLKPYSMQVVSTFKHYTWERVQGQTITWATYIHAVTTVWRNHIEIRKNCFWTIKHFCSTLKHMNVLSTEAKGTQILHCVDLQARLPNVTTFLLQCTCMSTYNVWCLWYHWIIPVTKMDTWMDASNALSMC